MVKGTGVFASTSHPQRLPKTKRSIRVVDMPDPRIPWRIDHRVADSRWRPQVPLSLQSLMPSTLLGLGVHRKSIEKEGKSSALGRQ